MMISYGLLGAMYIAAAAIAMNRIAMNRQREEDLERDRWMTRRDEERDRWQKRWDEERERSRKRSDEELEKSRKRSDEERKRLDHRLELARNERDVWVKKAQREKERLEICQRMMRLERQLWSSLLTKQLGVLFSLVSDDSLSSSFKEKMIREVAQPALECKTDQQSAKCVVCLDATACIASVPCGHMCVCEECRQRLCERGYSCPMCRAPVDLFVRIFS